MTSPFANSPTSFARHGFEKLVCRRRDVERLGIDEHVLDLDAVRVEQVQRLRKRFGRGRRGFSRRA